MEFQLGEWSTTVALMFATTVVGLLGLWLYASAWAKQAEVAKRSALDVAESKASRWRNRLDVRIRRTQWGHRLSVKLASAGVPFNSIEFLLIAAGVGLVGFLIADIVLPPLLSLIGAAAGMRFCWMWVERERNKRKLEFVQQLPEVARILSNASSAGLAITTAVQMAANELDEPAGTEMGLVAEELRLGQSLEGALHNLEERMPSREVGVLISTLVIQQRSGGDLVRALQDMAMTLDLRRDLHREVRTLMAGSVFTGWIVALLGVGSIVVLNLISPGVIEKMASRLIGQVALAIAGSLYFLGFVLIRRTTRIEV
ncbi:MAG TPA: type II secretion system F family protein [Actinomycetota bacterium]|jgi:tight adherence protein B|nr:type II secretion system F family protein [Actinomycetota bacterium]